MLVYAVYADKKTFHVTLLASGKAEGAVTVPSAPLFTQPLLRQR